MNKITACFVSLAFATGCTPNADKKISIIPITDKGYSLQNCSTELPYQKEVVDQISAVTGKIDQLCTHSWISGNARTGHSSTLVIKNIQGEIFKVDGLSAYKKVVPSIELKN